VVSYYFMAEIKSERKKNMRNMEWQLLTSQKAMLAYAEAMEYCDPSFANDLRAWAEDGWDGQELMEEGE